MTEIRTRVEIEARPKYNFVLRITLIELVSRVHIRQDYQRIFVISLFRMEASGFISKLGIISYVDIYLFDSKALMPQVFNSGTQTWENLQ